MTAIASNALTSVSDVKESLGIASSDHTKDNLITRKINQVSQLIENYCDRSFHAADYVEEYNGSLTDQLVLHQRPINSVTSLEYRGSSINEDSWRNQDADFYFTDSTAGILRLSFPAAGHWNRWRVTYNAGYTTIPADLAEAAASLAAYFVTNADGQVSVKSKQEGQRRIDYRQGITGFKSLLQQLGLEQVIDGYANWPLTSE